MQTKKKKNEAATGRAGSDEMSAASRTLGGGDSSSVYSQGRIKRSQSAKFPLDQNSTYERGLKRSISERRSLDDSETLSRRTGDIYTKVAMPRSKSFMNVSGQYNLQELFRELREKEGIESIDDILRHVISTEGMSYNKISPMYRELLMKLAMSMSGDEMFIRSKNIIMQQKMRKPAEPSSKFKLFGLFKGSSSNNSKSTNNLAPRVTKADISEPIPVSEKTKRKLTDHWMKVSPELAAAVGSRQLLQQQQQAAMTTQAFIPLKSSGNSVAVPRAKQPSPEVSSSVLDSSYMSCSECGYQSVCGTNCDCSMVTTTADEMLDEREK